MAGKGAQTGGLERSVNTVMEVEIIVPLDWAPVLWPALVHAGARAVGVNEWATVQTCLGRRTFPQDYPGTSENRCATCTFEFLLSSVISVFFKNKASGMR